MLRNERGFTLIELIIVIVILGLLSAVALPKYQDLKTDAEKASADGIYGAALAASAVNFANRLISPSRSNTINSIDNLILAMDGTSSFSDWTTSGSALKYAGASTTYLITLSANETATKKASLTKSW